MKNFKELLKDIKVFIFDVDGVLSANIMNLNSETGLPVRTGNVKDGYALHLASKLGYKVAIITGANTEYLKSRFAALGMHEDIYLGCHNKIVEFQALMEKYNLNPENVLYMGDDIPDMKVMKMVGVPCCPADAAPEIKEISKYISHCKGGEGCARDVIEQVLKAQDNWLRDDEATIW